MKKGVYVLSNNFAIEVELISNEVLRYKEVNTEWVEAEIISVFKPDICQVDSFGDMDLMDIDEDTVEEYIEESLKYGFYWGEIFIPLDEVMLVDYEVN